MWCHGLSVGPGVWWLVIGCISTPLWWGTWKISTFIWWPTSRDGSELKYFNYCIKRSCELARLCDSPARSQVCKIYVHEPRLSVSFHFRLWAQTTHSHVQPATQYRSLWTTHACLHGCMCLTILSPLMAGGRTSHFVMGVHVSWVCSRAAFCYMSGEGLVS